MCDLGGGDQALKILALARAGHGDAAVGPTAGADDRAVAHATEQLAEHPGRRGRGGQPTLGVARHAADRPVGQGAGRVIGIPSPGAGEPGVRIGDLGQALRLGEGGRAGAGQQHMRRPLQHGAGNGYRAFETSQRGDRPGPAGGAVHQAGVQFIAAGGVGRGAASGDVEAGSLQLGDHELNGFERRLSGQQPFAARLGEQAHVFDLAAVVDAAAGAGPAMQGESDAFGERGGHGPSLGRADPARHLSDP